MSRYNYNLQSSPPAPFVFVSIFRDDGGGSALDYPAKLDSGADLTVIPQSVADSVGLLPAGERRAAGFNGGDVVLRTFLVRIVIRNHPSITIEAVCGTNEDYVLPGRDVLNAHRIVFDGPNLVCTIE